MSKAQGAFRAYRCFSKPSARAELNRARRRFRTPGLALDPPTGAVLRGDICGLCPLFGQAPKRTCLCYVPPRSRPITRRQTGGRASGYGSTIPDYRRGRTELTWRVGIGAAHIAERRVAVAIATAARGHRLALRQGVEAAGLRKGRDVPATVLIRVR